MQIEQFKISKYHSENPGRKNNDAWNKISPVGPDWRGCRVGRHVRHGAAHVAAGELENFSKDFQRRRRDDCSCAVCKKSTDEHVNIIIPAG